MTIRGYERVSTKSQKLDSQRDLLEKAGCGIIYSEKVSGRKKDRPELLRLLSDMQAGDKIVVVSLSRFGRSVDDLIRHVGMVKERGCDFASLTENIDTTTAAGRLFFHIIASFAQYFSDMTRERIMDGLQKARDDGVVLGRPPSLPPETIETARRLIEVDDKPVRQVAAMLRISRQTLWRALKR